MCKREEKCKLNNKGSQNSDWLLAFLTVTVGTAQQQQAGDSNQAKYKPQVSVRNEKTGVNGELRLCMGGAQQIQTESNVITAKIWCETEGQQVTSVLHKSRVQRRVWFYNSARGFPQWEAVWTLRHSRTSHSLSWPEMFPSHERGGSRNYIECLSFFS